MCGFAGYLDTSRETNEQTFISNLMAMGAAINSRGPDDHGEWCDPETGIGLEHRRLSIIDLSFAGHQPMTSADGRYVIAYNGEVYNFPELRQQLEDEGNAPQWRGHSDTEIMLAAIVTWGFEKALKNFDGMFAFALWDRKEKTLTLARDKVGEKPLYYGWVGPYLLFGSTLSALKAHPKWQGNINRNALASYMRTSYVPAPYSIYENTRKLCPGTYITYSPYETAEKWPKEQVYWSAKLIAQQGRGNFSKLSATETVDHLEELLLNAVKSRMHSDVPLGAFLSGGFDSSTVVALMQAQSARPVQTFSIGFHEKGYNEAVHAKAVAEHIGTQHTELYVTQNQAMDVIPKLASIYDEPFADSSQIPTYLVSELAKKSVTVSLSGDGGDELFAGYNRYLFGNRIWQKMKLIPYPIRELISKALLLPPPNIWEVGMSILPSSIAPSQPEQKIQTLARMLNYKNETGVYEAFISQWKNPNDVIKGGTEYPLSMREYFEGQSNLDMLDKMMLADQTGYLPNDILTKVDRAAMAHSLETRIPLLDPKVIEFAWSLPNGIKIRDGKAKWPLREVLYRYVPRELMDRPKMGFAVPIADWLRGDMRDWVESLLSEKRLREEGFFNVDLVRKTWDIHLSGERNTHSKLWPVLMFQAWYLHEK